MFSNTSSIGTSSIQPDGPYTTPRQADPVPAVAEPCGNSAVLTRENVRQNPSLEANESSRFISSASPGNDRINALESRLGTLEHLVSLNTPKPSVDIPGAARLSESGYASNPVLLGAKPILNKSRLFGRTHWTNDVPEVGTCTRVVARRLTIHLVQTNK